MNAPRTPRPGDVWAPAAREVALHLPAADDGGAESVPLTRGDDDWWSADRDLPHGTDYAFVLDGGEPRPDPRSPWQPAGVHGPSRVFDASRHAWSDAGWPGRDVRGAVVYELHVGTYTPEGTLDAAAARLDHLAALGVEVVELLPVAPFNGVHGWGYDGVGLYGVHEPYGGPAALQRFVDAAHAAGLAVCLDVVHNHLGPSGNYLGEFGPYFTEAHHTPWGAAINLDGDGAEQLRRWIVDSALRWLRDFHVDALRLDAVHALVDDSPRHFLAELADAVAGWEAEAGRPLRLIAESDLNRSEMVSPTGSVPGARGMDAQWADDVHHALHSFLTGETQGYYVDFGSAEVLEKALTRVFVHDGGFSTFRGKDWGAPLDPGSDLYDGHSFVTFLQNHDQVGNRATGDRISRTVAPGAQAAGAALYLLSAFAPMVFMGEEWAASTPFPYFSHLGPELGPKVTEGRRREFADVGWADETPDSQSAETFRSAVLRWDERDEAAHARMLAWYRELIAIRHSRPDVLEPSLGSTQVQVLDDDTLVMRRGQVTVAVTRSSSAVEVDLGAATEVLASWDDPRELAPGRFLLPGPGALIAHRPDA